MYKLKYHTGDISGCSFLITGGAGFIGSNIVDYLFRFGAGKIRVLDNFSTGSTDNISEYMDSSNFELVEGDIRSADTCRQALQGIDYVFHEAALGSVPRSIDDPITSNSVNVGGFLNMIVAARDANAKMVYAASSSTYGDSAELPKVEDKIGNPLSPYAVTKYVNELYAAVFSKVYQFHTIGLRYFNVFGPRQNPNGPYAAVIPLFIQSAMNNQRPVINGDGSTSRDFTFIENVVQANIKAMLSFSPEKHEVFNVAYGTAVTLNELWEFISGLVGTNTRPRYREERKGDVKHSLADTSKARRLLNYDPSFDIRNGLSKSVQWYLEHTRESISASF